jgi:ABC-2 type transport system ATP-binding protein
MSIVVKNLTKSFGAVKAVDNLSFEVEKGEIVGFLGPNGAGKTTTARLITGYLRPTTGSVEVNGLDVREKPLEIRQMIGYLPEENPLYPDMDVLDYLELIAQLQNVPGKQIAQRIREVVRVFSLNDVKHVSIGHLSKGYRQRVGLAQAVVHDPPVLILDEPTNGLDPNQTLEFRNYISDLARTKTIILSTHALSEVQALCGRVIIIGKGRILADATLGELEKKYKGREGLLLEFERSEQCTPESVQRQLDVLSGIEAYAALTGDERTSTVRFYVETQKNIDLRKSIFDLAVTQGWSLIDLHKQRVRIEDVFHQLTTGRSS